MTGWEVQALKEAEDARIWEELNAPDRAEKQMKEAAVSMKQAEELIDKAENALLTAMDRLNPYPMENRVGSLESDLEDLRYSIRALREKYERGWRE